MVIQTLIQPKKSRQCGQHCLAMITGKSVQEIIDLIGTNRGTNVKQIVKALNTLNLTNSQRLIPRRKQPLPKLAICKIRREWNKSGGWHWVVLYDGYIYDSDPSKDMESVMPIQKYDEEKLKRKQKLSSYISIDI